MFDPTTLVGFHTWLSLVALVTGGVVLADLIAGRSRSLLTIVFLLTAVLTSITGFVFPFTGVLPSHVFGVISLIALAVSIAALYLRQLSGAWRLAYVLGLGLSVYLLAFVGVAQLFLKFEPLRQFAPTGAEAPFLIAQLVLLALFAGIGYASVRGFRETLPA